MTASATLTSPALGPGVNSPQSHPATSAASAGSVERVTPVSDRCLIHCRAVYIAGPMSGIPGLNYDAFHDAARQLRAHGLQVENPAENPQPPCKSWLGYMRMSLVQISRVDGVVMLPGWEESRGARLEHHIATSLGLPVWPLQFALSCVGAA